MVNIDSELIFNYPRHIPFGMKLPEPEPKPKKKKKKKHKNKKSKKS